MAILVRGGGVILQKSSHCSPLQPTLTWQFQSEGNSSKVLPLQPKPYIILSPLNKLPLTLTPFYPPCQPNSYLILPLWTNNPLTITPFYPPCSPLLNGKGVFPENPLTLTPIYPPWQPNSYIILPPLNKLSLTLTPFYPPWQPNF